MHAFVAAVVASATNAPSADGAFYEPFPFSRQYKGSISRTVSARVRAAKQKTTKPSSASGLSMDPCNAERLNLRFPYHREAGAHRSSGYYEGGVLT